MIKNRLFITVLILGLLSLEAFTQPVTNYGVNGSFSNIQKRLLLKQGTLSGADVNEAYETAVPVGDGTFYFRRDLIRGAQYNFIFQGKVKGKWQYEQIPNKGSFPTSTNNQSVGEKKGGLIIKTGDEKTRRKITVPTDGSAFYVFCNYGHHPNPPSVEAIPGDTRVVLKIRSQGRWGYGEPDVEYGGWFSVYRSKTDRGPYTFLTNLASQGGSFSYFTNTSLSNDISYYYVVIAHDAYGVTNALIQRGPFDKEVDIPDYETYVDQENIDAHMYSGYSYQADMTPHQAIDVIFKVENIEWDVVAQKDFLVWLTPWDEDGRRFIRKIPGRIIRVIPQSKDEG
ncbi:MAG: hypothetical protein JW827_07255 [Spirochaetes bacterium]|nr:hypothetical protein [Spirochaetota bacterium]